MKALWCCNKVLLKNVLVLQLLQVKYEYEIRYIVYRSFIYAQIHISLYVHVKM